MDLAPTVEPNAAPNERASAGLVTYRIENPATDRTLLNGFHTEPQFAAFPATAVNVAEFGSRELAQAVIDALAYRVELEVVEHTWPGLNDVGLSRLCRRVADTGASVNLLLWNPPRQLARALSGIGRRA